MEWLQLERLRLPIPDGFRDLTSHEFSRETPEEFLQLSLVDLSPAARTAGAAHRGRVKDVEWAGEGEIPQLTVTDVAVGDKKAYATEMSLADGRRAVAVYMMTVEVDERRCLFLSISHPAGDRAAVSRRKQIVESLAFAAAASRPKDVSPGWRRVTVGPFRIDVPDVLRFSGRFTLMSEDRALSAEVVDLLQGGGPRALSFDDELQPDDDETVSELAREEVQTPTGSGHVARYNLKGEGESSTTKAVRRARLYATNGGAASILVEGSADKAERLDLALSQMLTKAETTS